MTSIAEDLQKWRKFVVTFLTKKIKRGSFPQCRYFINISEIVVATWVSG